MPASPTPRRLPLLPPLPSPPPLPGCQRGGQRGARTQHGRGGRGGGEREPSAGQGRGRGRRGPRRGGHPGAGNALSALTPPFAATEVGSGVTWLLAGGGAWPGGDSGSLPETRRTSISSHLPPGVACVLVSQLRIILRGHRRRPARGLRSNRRPWLCRGVSRGAGWGGHLSHLLSHSPFTITSRGLPAFMGH